MIIFYVKVLNAFLLAREKQNKVDLTARNFYIQFLQTMLAPNFHW